LQQAQKHVMLHHLHPFKGFLVPSSARILTVAFALIACVQPAFAAADPFTADYRIRLSYLPMSVANGKLKLTMAGSSRYVADVSASGLGFAISAKSVGSLRGAEVIPASAAIDTQDGKGKKRTIRMAMVNGTVRAAMLNPPERIRPDTVPLKPEHKSGVVDPISAMVLPAQGGKPLLDSSQCNRTLPIFEGSERFDITLTYDRTEKVKTPNGYEGSVLVCKARYKPVAGHRSNRSQVKYMENNRTIEAWFAPVAEANALVPWRVSLGTPVGQVIVEASRFGK
jgi:hypothetical protein